MNAQTQNNTERGAASAFVDRCASLGLAPWRRQPGGGWAPVGSAGTWGAGEGMGGEGTGSGGEPALRAWLGTAAVGEMIKSAGAAPVTAWPGGGAWVLRVDGRERTAWRVLALSADVLNTAAGRLACEQAGLSTEAAREALGPLLRHDRHSADLMVPVLRQMLADLSALDEQRESLDGFTRQLTDSYETVNLLYAIGREMDDPARPEKFARFVCDRVGETSGLGWVGVGFVEGGKGGEMLPPTLRGRVVTTAGGSAWFERCHASLERLVAPTNGCQIIGAEWLPGGAGSETMVMPIVVDGELVGLLAGGEKSMAMAAGGAGVGVAGAGALSSYDTQMIEAAGRYLSALIRSSCLYAAQQAMFLGTVRSLTAAIDAKDHYTRGHSERVAMLARRLALATGADEAEADAVHIAGLLHDVGKIGVTEAVLCKQGKLSDEEFAFIRAHPEIGARILRDIPALAGAMPGVLHHHERYDGKGYPTGLSGDAIPRVARLLAVADAFDAMSSNRSYRPAMARPVVLEQVRKGAGTQFDATVAEAMLTIDLTDYDAMVAAAGAASAAQPDTNSTSPRQAA